jgi:Lhr-like helicase
MKVHTEGEAYSYWPGYVDALTNIVLNLLFLVAIFVIGVAALGFAAAQRKDIPPGARVSKTVPTVVERLQDVVRQVIVAAPGGASAVNIDVTVSVRQIEKQRDSLAITLGFGQDVFVIARPDELALMRELGPHLLNHKKLLVWTATRSDDNLLARAAMTRLLSTRNMLLRHGIQATQIEVRIVPGNAPRASSINVFIQVNEEDSHDEKK